MTTLPLGSIQAEVLWFIMSRTYQTGGFGVNISEIEFAFSDKIQKNKILEILTSLERTGAIESEMGTLGPNFRAK